MKKKVGRAVAELGLIFVGITLALAFESWNTDRLERAQEQELLGALADDLEETLSDLRRDIVASERTQQELGRVLAWQEGASVTDSALVSALAGTVGEAYLFPKVSAYESIKTIGLDLVSDPQLRSAITSLFELTLVRVKFFEDARSQLQYEVVMPFLRRNTAYAGEGGVMEVEWRTGSQLLVAPLDRLRPLDVDALRVNPEYRLIVRERLTAEAGVLQAYRLLESEAEHVLVLLGHGVED